MDGRLATWCLSIAAVLAAMPFSRAAAQSPAISRPAVSAFEAVGSQPPEGGRPVELPPLLAVPPNSPPASPPPPLGGPAGDYDHRLFYLPETAPVAPAGSSACGPDGRFWISPALQLGWTKSAGMPVLLRTGAPTGPALFGGNTIDSPFRAGFGLTGGFWLDEDRTRGIDASYYFLAEGSRNTRLFSSGRSFFLPTATAAFPLADPAAGFVGSFEAGLATRFSTADVNYRQNLLCTPAARLDALAGYRYLHLTDELALFGKRPGPGTEIVRFWDKARAVNQFHGGQIGLAGEVRQDGWFLAANGKVAFGQVFTDTDLEGKFRHNGTVIPAGFYSRPDVRGEREASHYAVVPTVGVSLGHSIGNHGRAYVGYNFIYINQVVRGPDVVDPTPAVVAADPLDTATLRSVPNQRDSATSDFWAQSMSFGLEWRY